MAFVTKTQQWALPMTLDEAIHYEGTGTMKALTTGEQDCTNADVWRASTATLVVGRKKTPVAPAAPAPAEQDEAPADAAVAPVVAATKPAPTTEAPADVAIAPVDTADAAIAAQAEALVQSAPPSADELVTKKAEQSARPRSGERSGALGQRPTSARSSNVMMTHGQQPPLAA